MFKKTTEAKDMAAKKQPAELSGDDLDQATGGRTNSEPPAKKTGGSTGNVVPVDTISINYG